MNRKAIIAMSGGVDSSVAAWLMQEQGYDCIGVTMKLFDNEDIGVSREHSCCSLADVEDARSVAYEIGIPYYVFNFAERFRETVIQRFIEAYENGATPNPCIDCNRYLKFDTLYERARQLGYDSVVTGHYARISFDKERSRYLLKKGKDESKDQSYVLYSMTQEQLAHTQFPLGEMKKSEVREIATAHGFINAAKHDSQDICFVQNGKYSDFIEAYTGKNYPEGNFVSKSGAILGRHKGIIRYTIGQRKGLGVSLGAPMYVCEIKPEGNEIVLGDEADLYSRVVIANHVNLIAVPEIRGDIRVKAKIRYRQPEQWATVTQLSETELRVVFDEPQRAVTKGQAVVLYDHDTVLAGGTIASTE